MYSDLVRSYGQHAFFCNTLSNGWHVYSFGRYFKHTCVSGAAFNAFTLVKLVGYDVCAIEHPIQLLGLWLCLQVSVCCIAATVRCQQLHTFKKHLLAVFFLQFLLKKLFLFTFFFFKVLVGWHYGSVSKGACGQAWWSEFDLGSWLPQVILWLPCCCCGVNTCTQASVRAHTRTYTHKYTVTVIIYISFGVNIIFCVTKATLLIITTSVFMKVYSIVFF